MQKFSFEIEIEATTEQEAEEKLQAFINLSTSMDHQDLIECCDFVETHPNTVLYAKQQLPKLNGKDMSSIIFMAPELIKGIKKAMDEDQANLEDEED